jgi:hypothetical protein
VSHTFLAAPTLSFGTTAIKQDKCVSRSEGRRTFLVRIIRSSVSVYPAKQTVRTISNCAGIRDHGPSLDDRRFVSLGRPAWAGQSLTGIARLHDDPIEVETGSKEDLAIQLTESWIVFVAAGVLTPGTVILLTHMANRHVGPTIASACPAPVVNSGFRPIGPRPQEQQRAALNFRAVVCQTHFYDRLGQPANCCRTNRKNGCPQRPRLFQKYAMGFNRTMR